ncbi:hypothetical protein H632_c843p0, partial [Helicosporidium sp. ATCC 50920]
VPASALRRHRKFVVFGLDDGVFGEEEEGDSKGAEFGFLARLPGRAPASAKEVEDQGPSELFLPMDAATVRLAVAQTRQAREQERARAAAEADCRAEWRVELDLEGADLDGVAAKLRVFREGVHVSSLPRPASASEFGGSGLEEALLPNSPPFPDPPEGWVSGFRMTPCEVALGSRFPLNGTYFQINELFLNGASLDRPWAAPRALLEGRQSYPVYFGHSIHFLSRKMCCEIVQDMFTVGYMCCRAWEPASGSPLALPLCLLPSERSKRALRTVPRVSQSTLEKSVRDEEEGV